MSNQYTRSTFIRQAPKPLLKEYFQRSNLLKDVSFEKLQKHECQPVLDAIDNLPEKQRDQIDRDFQDVHALANLQGTRIVREEVQFHKLRIADKLEGMKTHHHRAMWLFLNREHNGIDVFDTCAMRARLESMSFTKSKRSAGLPKKEPLCDPAAIKNFENQLSGFYRKQGRGYKCTVEHYYLYNPRRHVFVAYTEDFTTSELQYDGNKLTNKYRKPVFEVALIFTPEEGTLEVSAPGSKKDAMAIQDIFCRTNLRLLGLPEKARFNHYELDLLKDPEFEFTTDPKDDIKKVEILSMRLGFRWNLKQRVTLDQDFRTGESVHDLLDRTLDTQKINLNDLRVTYVKMRFTWYSRDGKRPKTCTFTLTWPDYTSLGDDETHRLVKGYLKLWKIAP